LLVQLGLDSFEQAFVDNGGLLASQGLSLEDHFADVKPVAKQMGERTTEKTKKRARRAKTGRGGLSSEPD
jgi:hypothetical protein